MKTVFMYAGQGSQKAQMGKDIYENLESYKKVIDSLTISDRVKELMHEAPLEVLSQTDNTQPAMAAFAAGVTSVLAENGIKPDAALGLSLGEYGALYAAGVFDADTYVNITAYRGMVMNQAAKECDANCAMSAVLGLESSQVEAGCKANEDKGFITVANYNCPGQYVICGDEEAVAATEEYLKANGAKRCVRLNVSGPFHTKYMEGASKKLREYIEGVEFNAPTIPVVLNVTGDFYDEKDNLKDILEKQVKSSVHFEESIKKLIAAGADTFVEIGPGNALSGFVKKTIKELGAEVTISQIESYDSLVKYIESRKEA